ncbi:hypothetical protein EJ06DRAFT_295181 [Trichodelitschia bisporula]|uniref:DUF6603 domain-containing protein n=1 Tax=Trichodelitschia bisporula TaxID=703511 RepID=A0A6G1I6J8_9PEZI|nr:hypothetical protein EJ06DRAFT_295181 [Trichodelitschia bisporula]
MKLDALVLGGGENDDQKKAFVKYQMSMLRMMIDLGAKYNYLMGFAAAGDPKGLDALTYVLTQVAEAWPNMSQAVSATNPNDVALVAQNVGYSAVRSDQKIEFVKVFCRPRDRNGFPPRFANIDGYSLDVSRTITTAAIDTSGSAGGRFYERYMVPGPKKQKKTKLKGVALNPPPSVIGVSSSPANLTGPGPPLNASFHPYLRPANAARAHMPIGMPYSPAPMAAIVLRDTSSSSFSVPFSASPFPSSVQSLGSFPSFPFTNPPVFNFSSTSFNPSNTGGGFPNLKRTVPSGNLDLKALAAKADILSGTDGGAEKGPPPPEKADAEPVKLTGPIDLIPASFAKVWEKSGRTNTTQLIPDNDYGMVIKCFEDPLFTIDSSGLLDADDTVGLWLLRALGRNGDKETATINLSLSPLTGTTNTSVITAIKITLPSADTFPQLVFSTAESSLRGNFSGPDDPEVLPANGIFPFHLFVGFGLDKAASSSDQWTIAQILQYNKLISDSAGAVFQALAVEFGETGEFDLKKGMLWYIPLESNRVVQRMEWHLSDALQTKVSDFLNKWLGKTLSLSNVSVVSRKSSRMVPSAEGYDLSGETELILSFDLTIGQVKKMVTVDLDFNLKTGGNTITLTLKFDSKDDSKDDTKEKSKDGDSKDDDSKDDESGSSGATLGDVIKWLETLLQVSLSEVTDLFPKIDAAGVKRVELQCSKGSIDRFSVDLEVVPGWKDQAEGGKDIIFLFSYSWTKDVPYPHSLHGSVWFDVPELAWLAPQIMPDYEESRVIQPSHPAVSKINLQSIMPSKDFAFPSELDLAISNFEVAVDGPTVSLTGTLTASAKPGSHLGIELVEEPDQSSYTIKLETEIDLDPVPGAIVAGDPELDSENLAVIRASVSLVSVGTDKFFKLFGSIDNLQMAQLGRFFPADDFPIVNDILGHLAIRNLAIEYDYSSKGGTANQFYINAAIIIDVLELDFTFFRNTEHWAFHAELTVAEGVKATVERILKAMLGSDGSNIVDSMPAFVTGIDLSKGKAGIRLTIDSVKPSEPAKKAAASDEKKGNSSIVFALTLYLPAPGGTQFEVTFVQIIEKDPNAAKATTDKGANRSRTKRIVKVTLNDLPWALVPRPPIVDQMVPAFDQLGFYWIQDPTGKPDAAGSTGITLEEIGKINTAIPFPIQFKESAANAVPQTVVLTAGWHFMVMDGGGHGEAKVLLDYALNKPGTDPNDIVDDSKDSSDTTKTPDSGVPAKTEDGQGTSKGAVEKTVGTFKISNVGIRFENGELILFLDVIAHLGPIEFALIGLGFGMKLSELKLNEIGKHVPSFHLQGMAIEFNQPPVGIAGMFVDKSNDDMKMYIGGIALTVLPYQFMAIGAYGEVKKNLKDKDSFAEALKKGNTFKTVFIFAKLNGPLIELEIATLGGITLGFGYNSTVVHPRIEDVTSFPFISNSSDLSGSGDPLAVMMKLADPVGGIVRPQENSYWLAAGLEGKALQILDISAVVIIEFNPYVSLGLYARASASMPPETPRQACFTYVEMGIMAYCDFHQGQLRIEAQLSPNSFLMSPLCHLSGGFALCYWFGNSPYAGDFVFSMGGYHPAFKPPTHYPVPPRLAITWQLSKLLSIRGEAYFAITTKVCMGGGMLNAVFNMGLLHAYLTAHADFLMQFHPFFFTADIGVRIGVEFELELLFITIHISVHLSAELHLQGPPFGGQVYVDFYVFGFTVPFGHQVGAPPAKTVDEFYTLLTNIPDADSSGSNEPSAANPNIDKLHVLSVEQGRFTEKQKDAESAHTAMWEVKRGGFVFRVQSRIPLQSVREPAFATDPSAEVLGPAPFFAKPMQLTEQLISTMKVYVRKEVAPSVPATGNVATEEVATGDAATEGNPNEAATVFEDLDFRISAKVLKAVPSSLWGFYDPNESPGTGNNNITSLLTPDDKGTMTLMMGASFTAPPPSISPDLLQPFNALDMSALDVFADDEVEPSLPSKVTLASTSFAPAEPAALTLTSPANMHWTTALAAWKAPTLTSGDRPPKPPPAPGTGPTLPVVEKQIEQQVVRDAIETWTWAFGWDNGGVDGTGNFLRNEVTSEGGAEPLVWGGFEKLYMAAPMVSV